MTAQTHSEELLNFFKALADANRLKIIGLLAQQPYTGEQLAEMLGLSASTVSHHLSMLAHVELVSARSEQYYNVYSLNVGALHAMAQRLLSRDDLPRLAEDVDRTAYDRKVLKTFVRADGSIKSFPAQEKKFQVLLYYVLNTFEPGKRYSEKQVNNLLSRYSDDTAALRRGLIEYRLMAREVAQGSSTYWRIDQ